MAVLGDVGRGVRGGRAGEEGVAEPLPLQLVPGGEDGGTGGEVGPGGHGVGRPAVLRAFQRGGLEPGDAERPLEEDAFRAEAVVRHAVAEASRGPVLEAQQQAAEARLATAVGIVRRGDEVGAVQPQLVHRHTVLVAFELGRGEGDGGRDSLGKGADREGRLVERGGGLGGVDAGDEAGGRREAEAHARLQARVVGVVVPVEAARPVEAGHGEAAGQPIAPEAACRMGAASQEAEGASLEEQAEGGGAAGVGGQEVNDAPDRMRAVQRRSRPAEDLDAVEAGNGEVAEQTRGVALRPARVAEARAVDEDGGVPRAQAAGHHAGGRAWGAELLDAQAGDGAEDIGQHEIAARLHLATPDHGEGLRDLARGLRAVRRGDHDLLAEAAQHQVDVELERVAGVDPHPARPEAREAGGLGGHVGFAGGQAWEQAGAVGGGGAHGDRPAAPREDGDLDLSDRRPLRVAHLQRERSQPRGGGEARRQETDEGQDRSAHGGVLLSGRRAATFERSAEQRFERGRGRKAGPRGAA